MVVPPGGGQDFAGAVQCRVNLDFEQGFIWVHVTFQKLRTLTVTHSGTLKVTQSIELPVTLLVCNCHNTTSRLHVRSTGKWPLARRVSRGVFTAEIERLQSCTRVVSVQVRGVKTDSQTAAVGGVLGRWDCRVVCEDSRRTSDRVAVKATMRAGLRASGSCTRSPW